MKLLLATLVLFGAQAFAQSNVTTDSSVTTDTTTAAGMKGQDSVRPSDSTMGESTVQKRTVTEKRAKQNDADGAKSGSTRSVDESTLSTPTSTTDDSQK